MLIAEHVTRIYVA